MKKSQRIILNAVFIAALSIEGCGYPNQPSYEDKWISGNSSKKDTMVNNRPFRFYNGMWYPVFNNSINPGTYEGFSNSQVRTGGSDISPRMVTRSSGWRSSGFGGSSHPSVGA